MHLNPLREAHGEQTHSKQKKETMGSDRED
jgi:hypothetical protein